MREMGHICGKNQHFSIFSKVCLLGFSELYLMKGINEWAKVTVWILKENSYLGHCG